MKDQKRISTDSPNMTKLKEILTNFKQKTTMAGIRFIFNGKLSVPIRICWLVIFLTCLILCSMKCQENVIQFLKFNFKATITVSQGDRTQFPAITFCSMSKFRRQVFTEEAMRLELLKNPPLHSTSRTFSIGSAQCFWGGNGINCSDVCINQEVDHLDCFTFNIGSDMVDTAVKLGGFGLNETSYKDNWYKYRTLGLATDSTIAFLLNANRSAYFPFLKSKPSVGFLTLVFEFNDLPSSSTDDAPIFLDPGYIHKVVVKKTLIRKYVAHLGACSTDWPLTMFPRKSRSTRTMCFMDCYFSLVVQVCQCYPEIYSGIYAEYQQRERGQSSNLSACESFRQMVCAAEKQRLVPNICDRCSPACFETKFDFQMSKSLLALSTLKNHLPEATFADLDSESDLNKDYVYVSFTFDSGQTEIVSITQEMTLLDLFIAVGNNVILWLGMSFMSNFEIIIQLILYLLVLGVRVLVETCFGGQKIHPTKKRIVRILIKKGQIRNEDVLAAYDNRNIFVIPKDVDTNVETHRYDERNMIQHEFD